jgi:hypothetical protein
MVTIFIVEIETIQEVDENNLTSVSEGMSLSQKSKNSVF